MEMRAALLKNAPLASQLVLSLARSATPSLARYEYVYIHTYIHTYVGSSTVDSERSVPKIEVAMASAANSGTEQPPIRTQTLTPTISVEYHNDNQIFLLHRKPDGSVQREQTSAMIVDAMYDMKKRSAMSSLSDISGITGTAQAGPIKEEDEVDYSALEWGDMDPNYRRELEQRPDVKAALHKFHHRHKIARLTPTGDFQEMDTTTIPAPNNPPAVDEGLKEQPITGSVLDTALSSYHEQHIQPRFQYVG